MILLDHQQSETIAGVIYESSTIKDWGTQNTSDPQDHFLRSNRSFSSPMNRTGRGPLQVTLSPAQLR
jgi:hypothetical protein